MRLLDRRLNLGVSPELTGFLGLPPRLGPFSTFGAVSARPLVFPVTWGREGAPGVLTQTVYQESALLTSLLQQRKLVLIDPRIHLTQGSLNLTYGS